MTGSAAVSVDIELRCLTLYLAATAQLLFNNTFSSHSRVDVRHRRRRYSNVWHLSVSLWRFLLEHLPFRRFWAASVQFSLRLFLILRLELGHLFVLHTSKFSWFRNYHITCRCLFSPSMTSACHRPEAVSQSHIVTVTDQTRTYSWKLLETCRSILILKIEVIGDNILLYFRAQINK